MLEKKTGIKVGDIMTRNFVSVKPDTSLIYCAREMIKKRVGSLILRENGKLRGLITERDIIWALVKKSKKDLKNIKAKDISLRKVTTIKPSADLSQAFEKIRKTRLRWLPVVANGNILGFLTLKDILKFHPGFFESVKEGIEIREETEKRKRISSPNSWNEGLCEECGNYDLLYNLDGRLICEACKNIR